MRALLLPLVLATAVVVVGATVSAQPVQEAPVSGADLYQAARAAEDAEDLVEALDLYRRAIEADPSARWASRVIAKIRALERATADPAVAALEALKSTYDDPDEALREAEALLDIATTDPGRAEVHLWIASQHRLITGDPVAAVDHYVAVARLEGAPPGQIEQAVLMAARSAHTPEQLRFVRGVIEDVAATRPDVDPDGLVRPRDEIADALLRRIVRPVSAVALVTLLALFIRRRGWRELRTVRIAALALIVYVFVTGAWLSHRWEHGYAHAFLTATGTALAAHALARGARPADDAPQWERVATGLVVALASFGAIYLVFDAFDRQAIFGL